MRKDYTVFFTDIEHAIKKIADFIDGLSYDEFVNDDKTFSAVSRKIEIISEAASNIPSEIALKYPDIPLEEMSRIKEKFVHGYLALNNKILWKLIKEGLPEILPLIVNMNNQEKNPI